MVMAVHRGNRPKVGQGAYTHIDVRMLQLKLDRDREGPHHRDLLRNAKQEPRERPYRDLDELMDRVLQKPVEPVHSANRMVNRVKAPENRDAVAGEMSQTDPGVEENYRKQQLNPKRKGGGP